MMELYHTCSLHLRRKMLVQLMLSWGTPVFILGVGMVINSPILSALMVAVVVAIICENVLPFTVNKRKSVQWYILQIILLMWAAHLYISPEQTIFVDILHEKPWLWDVFVYGSILWSIFWFLSTLSNMWHETKPQRLSSFSWVFWTLEEQRMYYCFGESAARTPVVQFINAVEPSIQEQGVRYPAWWLRLFAQHILLNDIPNIAVSGKLSEFYEMCSNHCLEWLFQWGAPQEPDQRWIYGQQLARNLKEFITYYYQSPHGEGFDVAELNDFS